MMLQRTIILLFIMALFSCAGHNKRGTIAELDAVSIDLKDEKVDGGFDKAMEGYEKFLEQTPNSELAPEAMRRLADLKVEKEYGVVADNKMASASNAATTVSLDSPGVTTKAVSPLDISNRKSKPEGKKKPSTSVIKDGETEAEFEKRTTGQQATPAAPESNPSEPSRIEAGEDLKNADAEEAIQLYKKLLAKYPMYERSDQVLYQLSRAYEETGQVEEAMQVMNKLVKQFPDSRYGDEVQFRRGEYYFTRKKYLDAEEAYGAVLKFGVSTVYYQRALYKKGWTFYKEQLYEEALQEFFALLDSKVSKGYDFDQTEDDIERKRTGDTLRVISLSFSNMGGADSVHDYFEKHGSRAYEDIVYRELAEFYFTKRRYNDAATAYNKFVAAHPFHKKSPQFSMRVIEIYMKGGFPRLVVAAKKQFAAAYGLDGDYWRHVNQADHPEVLGYLKKNLIDLADHYHSLYQNAQFKKDKPENFVEASHWYREYLKSFPKDETTPGINYQLADLLLENKDYKAAAAEYERSAYDYPVNDKSQKAAYAAVYAYREYLKMAPAYQIKDIKQKIIQTSLRLVDTFPKHEKAAVVLGALVDDLFEMRDYEFAIKVGHRLIDEYPVADTKFRRGAWLVVAHSNYEIEKYQDAEQAYLETLKMTATDDKDRQGLVDDLAASVYKQGERARKQEDYKTAVSHFLRIAEVAPTSKIRPSAEYDAAAVLIQIKELDKAESVLLSFRQNYPGHELQHDVTSKLAYVYQESGKYVPAGQEYERVAMEADKEELTREALLTAAELYGKAKDTDDSLRVYKQYVTRFPKPLETALETYYKIAMIYKSRDNLRHYRGNLQYIIIADREAGKERTDRTRYLAAQASLVLIEPRFEEYKAIQLVEPFKVSLNKKQKSMKSLVKRYTRLIDYNVADVTAASTYHIAEIYYNFSRSLLSSERPDNLSRVELDEFNEMLEEQAFPFEEKAIQVHEKNVALLRSGIYSTWIDRSIEKLVKLLPARYNKPEESTNYVTKMGSYTYYSPRYAREDASTDYITYLHSFRYQSQKQTKAIRGIQPGADTEVRTKSKLKTDADVVESPVRDLNADLSALDANAAGAIVSAESGSQTDKAETDVPKEVKQTDSETVTEENKIDTEADQSSDSSIATETNPDVNNDSTKIDAIASKTGEEPKAETRDIQKGLDDQESNTTGETSN